MKIRNGFVSNSSSTSYTIFNKSSEVKTIMDFVKENEHLITEFNEYYGCKYTLEEVLKSAEERRKNCGDQYDFQPKQEAFRTFGDEDCDAIGDVYDYMLREGGESENFIWRFKSMNR